MAENKKQIVIIKKKRGGDGGGFHGGAWKVAYADFVTAMMAFFLVMWLMGADEETKAAIEHYFNHPHTPWSSGRDPHSDQVYPLGERQGSGENVLNGLDGQLPEDLIERVARPQGSNEKLQLNRELKELVEEIMEGQAYGIDVNIEFMKFSIPASLLFEDGTTEIKASARRVLGKVGQIFRGYPGFITIEGHTRANPEMKGRFDNPFEFSLARAVSVMNYFVQNKWTREDKLIPSGKGAIRKYTSGRSPAAEARNDRIEFTLSLSKEL